MAERLPEERLTEIRADLAAAPAPPWPHAVTLLEEADRARAAETRLCGELDRAQAGWNDDREELVGLQAEADLSVRQRAILTFLRHSLDHRGYPPSIREICDAVGVTSTSTVAHHLRMLERAGFVRRDARRTRGLRLTAPEPAEGAR